MAALLFGGHPRAERSPAPVAAVQTPSAQPSTSRSALAAELERLLDRRFLKDAKISIHVRDLATGTTVFDRDGSAALNPASNVKLVTTAAALSILGPSHRYETAVKAAPPVDGTIRGDIFLVGGGDPSLLTGDLYELASRLRAQGIGILAYSILNQSSKLILPQYTF